MCVHVVRVGLLLHEYDYLGDLVKLAEEFVEHVDQFTWGAVASQPGEAYDVCIQDTDTHTHKTSHGLCFWQFEWSDVKQ